MFNWKWYLSELKNDKDIKVFSCFSCGGGSSMGYKRAGFKVLGNVEIDKRINEVYKENLHPKYNFLMDVREFNKLKDIPEELFNLDILDGSPPCSVFSTAGQREKNWGKEKTFREGQKKQVLDDLFFVFLETVEKLKPKVVVAENVTGLLNGNAKGYINLIIKRFRELGYSVQIFKLNSAFMNVPQVRERIFFIANSQGFPELKLNFNERIIKFGEVRSEKGIEPKKGSMAEFVLNHACSSDKYYSDVYLRLGKKPIGYTNALVSDKIVCPTIVSGSQICRLYDRKLFSMSDYKNVQTFPQDYNFLGQSAKYICGMSVPPNMMANIASKIYNQWFL